MDEDDIARAARARKGSPFLSTEQAAFYLGLSSRKLQAMRGGNGPHFRRRSRYVRSHVDDLDAWSMGRVRRRRCLSIASCRFSAGARSCAATAARPE